MDNEIVAALRRKAEKGDPAAARELREWRSTEQSGLSPDAWMALFEPGGALSGAGDHRSCASPA
jgi:hypothetical protein